MVRIKEWLIDNGYTDMVEQVMYPEQGYLRAIKVINRKIVEKKTYDETLPLMLQTVNLLKLDLELELDKKEGYKRELQEMED